MGVTCQILINRPRRGVHKAGKPVSGIVRYAVDKPERYKEVIISLVGKGKCSWSETKRNHHQNRDETITYIGRETYTSQHISIHEKGPEGDIILSPGAYDRPFSFVLPNNIPSSFKNRTCTISYKLVLKFVKPSFFSANSQFDTEIDVIGNVYPTIPEGVSAMELEKTLFKIFTRKKHRVHLQMVLPNTIFKPSENVQLSYKIKNDTNVIIPAVRAELVCHTIYTADCGKRITSNKTIDGCTVETPSIPDNATASLTSIMPLAGYVYTIQNSRIMYNEYSIKVTLKLPMPYINSSMKLPIVIGEKYGEDDVEIYVGEAQGPVEEPPSYFEVMNEGKIDKEKD